MKRVFFPSRGYDSAGVSVDGGAASGHAAVCPSPIILKTPGKVDKLREEIDRRESRSTDK